MLRIPGGAGKDDPELMTFDEIIRALDQAVAQFGIDWRAWALAWARVLPAVVLVPAFGLRALPAPARAAVGLMLAAAIAPALRPLGNDGSVWPWALGLELLNGLPPAITAAMALWVSSMVGGLVDNLTGAQDRLGLPNVEAGTSPLGALLAMLAAVVFLETGGVAHLCAMLADQGRVDAGSFVRAAAGIVGGIEFAVAVAAPLAVTSLVVEVAALLIARAAQPAPLGAVLAPLRTLALLGAFAILLDRLLEQIVRGFP